MLCVKSFSLILYFVLTVKYSKAKLQVSPASYNEEDAVVFRKYAEMDKQLKDMANSGVKKALPLLMQASESMNLTSKCVGNILQLGTGIRKLKLSAVTFLDASGKPAGGLLNGNMHMLGDYDQCLSAKMEQRNGEIAFRGQYCLIHYRPLLPKKKRPVTFHSGVEELVEATRNASEVVQFFVSKSQLFYYNPSKYGACVPSGCNMKDVEQIVNHVGEQFFVNASVVYCDADEDIFLGKKNIVFISLFVMIGVLVLTGTLVEYYSWKKSSILKSAVTKLFICFSLLTNFPKVVKKKGSDNNISCLNGIRALSLFYIILLHQYYAVVKYFITSHASLSMDEIPQFFFQIVANGFLIADVFFFMGGLLNCYTRMKMKETEKRKTNVLLIILHRLTRIGPAYMFFSFLMSLFRPYGPMRLFEKNTYVEKCDKYWWQNTLFINNFFFQDDTCAPHTWYIAADMQLFLLSLFTVPIFFKYPKRGIILNSAVAIFGIIFTVIWSSVYKLTPGVVFYRPNEEEINRAWNAHTSTFPHIAPYFAGILMGYFLAEKKDIKMSKIVQLTGWIVASILFITMLFVTKVWNSGGAFTLVDSSFYFGFSKILFAMAIAWMVFCCTNGNGGIINYILSLPMWVPISNITFVVYLVAPFLQTFYFANSRTVVDGHRMPLIWRFAGDAVISCSLGFALVLLIELPFVELERLLFYRPKQNKANEKPVYVNNGITEEKKPCNNDLELNHQNEISPCK